MSEMEKQKCWGRRRRLRRAAGVGEMEKEGKSDCWKRET